MDNAETPVFQRIDWIFIAFFFVSFLNSALGTVFYIALLFYWRYGVEGCVKALLLLTVRGIINPALAATSGNMVKLMVMLATSVVVIFRAELSPEDRKKSNSIIAAVFAFVIVTAVSAFMVSCYPVTAISKLVSFVLPFCAVLMGVAATRNSCRWCDYFTGFFSILFLVSFILIPFSRFRTINQRFQGVFNHVNILGIVSALFLAVLMESRLFKKKKVIHTIIILAVLWMVYLSGSRTGMLTAVAVLAAYYLIQKIPAPIRVLEIAVLLLLVLLVMLLSENGLLTQITDKIYDFLYKGHEESIWYSREGILEEAKRKYSLSPLFGSGFMVPYDSIIISYDLNFDLVVEPGNLIWALLGDTGIVGTILFAIFLLVVLLNGNASRVFLIIGAILVNMGEMVFFSSNNMSVLVYFLIALYLFQPAKDIGEENNENCIFYTNTKSWRV